MIRPDLRNFNMVNCEVGVLDEMYQYAGCVARITRAWGSWDANKPRYKIDVDNNEYTWEDLLFIPYVYERLKQFLEELCSR